MSHVTYDYFFKTQQYKMYSKHTTLSEKIIISNLFAQKAKTYSLVSSKKQKTIIFNLNLKTSMRSDFRYLTFNLFRLFFSNSKVDIPKVLLSLEALTRPSNQVTTYKFNNYLMNSGNFIKSLTQLNISWNDSLNNFFMLSQNTLSWYFVYNQLNHTYTKQHKHTPITTLNQLLTTYIRKAQPIFSLYVYKISKNIYKNTRGKSGKFMFLWKYVPTYKRLFIVTSWLIKELGVLPQRKLKLRLTQLLLNMSQAPTKTWAHRIKFFSYNYVYRSCRKTLASTYTSVKV